MKALDHLEAVNTRPRCHGARKANGQGAKEARQVIYTDRTNGANV